MSEKYNINNYNHVKVEKLGGNSAPQQQETRNNEDKIVKSGGYTQLNVQEYTDSNSEFENDEAGDSGVESSGNESSGVDGSGIDTDSDDESTTSSVSGILVGGKEKSDTDSVSSVSTTEILSKDPLFLVLSEFLMDAETGDNIVNVGNNIVKVLSKINSKLGRIADVLEKKHKDSKKRND
jgi:hypothetical protein